MDKGYFDVFIQSKKLILHVKGEIRFLHGKMFREFIVYFFILFAFKVGFKLVVISKIVLNEQIFLLF